MQLKISSQRSLFIVSVAAVMISMAVISFLIFYLPSHVFGYYFTNIKSLPPALGLPVRLKIPKINVNAAVEYVGLTKEGAVDVPKGPDNAAWFNLSSRPGSNGVSIISGHYGTWKNGKGSVFDNLYKLRKGDKIYIEDEKGVIITFVVRESRRYDPNADASYVFSSSDGKPHLNLITCEGVWDNVQKTYSNRLVVFTDLEIRNAP